MKIYLASQSPRRRQLLEQIGVEHELIDVYVDENWDPTEPVKNYVRRIALEKARAGFGVFGHGPVLGADTAVVLDNVVLGKATNRDEAKAMLQRLSGRTHEVLSAVAIIDGVEQVLLNTSRVCFKPLTDDEIENYCNTGEPLGKAGGYAVQGYAAVFVSRLEGSYSGVMGLPLFETMQLLDSLKNDSPE